MPGKESYLPPVVCCFAFRPEEGFAESGGLKVTIEKSSNTEQLYELNDNSMEDVVVGASWHVGDNWDNQ